ncbi:hypothetical protein HYW35_00005, partial [Candidatus Saccharibacteria bacterium]|nr:hypothetical protein [Candidatus Saccharibacteria bacterium]
MLMQQKGLAHLGVLLLLVLVISTIGLAGWKVLDHKKSPASLATSSSVAKQPSTKPSDPLAALPDISYFKSHPTDQFIVDFDVIGSGHPYKGKRAITPHTGGHVNFEDMYKKWPRGGTAHSNYPPIYAVADGVI